MVRSYRVIVFLFWSCGKKNQELLLSNHRVMEKSYRVMTDLTVELIVYMLVLPLVLLLDFLLVTIFRFI